MAKMKPESLPQHREKSGREIGREARSRSFSNEIGMTPICTLPGPIIGPKPTPPSQLAAAIQAVKG